MTRACQSCPNHLPVGAHGNQKFCETCGQKREQERKRLAHLRRVQNKRITCRSCKRTLVRARTKAAGICWECEIKEQKAAQAEAAAAAAADQNVQAEWRAVLQRAARNKGPEFAAQFATELNKHRRRNGLPEVRL